MQFSQGNQVTQDICRAHKSLIFVKVKCGWRSVAKRPPNRILLRGQIMHSPQSAGENMLGFLCPSLKKKKSSEQNNIQNTALVSGKIQRHVSSLNHST